MCVWIYMCVKIYVRMCVRVCVDMSVSVFLKCVCSRSVYVFVKVCDMWNNIPHYTQTETNGKGPCEPSLTS